MGSTPLKKQLKQTLSPPSLAQVARLKVENAKLSKEAGGSSSKLDGANTWAGSGLVLLVDLDKVCSATDRKSQGERLRLQKAMREEPGIKKVGMRLEFGQVPRGAGNFLFLLEPPGGRATVEQAVVVPLVGLLLSTRNLQQKLQPEDTRSSDGLSDDSFSSSDKPTWPDVQPSYDYFSNLGATPKVVLLAERSGSGNPVAVSAEDMQASLSDWWGNDWMCILFDASQLKGVPRELLDLAKRISDSQQLLSLTPFCEYAEQLGDSMPTVTTLRKFRAELKEVGEEEEEDAEGPPREAITAEEPAANQPPAAPHSPEAGASPQNAAAPPLPSGTNEGTEVHQNPGPISTTEQTETGVTQSTSSPPPNAPQPPVATKQSRLQTSPSVLPAKRKQPTPVRRAKTDAVDFKARGSSPKIARRKPVGAPQTPRAPEPALNTAGQRPSGSRLGAETTEKGSFPSRADLPPSISSSPIDAIGCRPSVVRSLSLPSSPRQPSAGVSELRRSASDIYKGQGSGPVVGAQEPRYPCSIRPNTTESRGSRIPVNMGARLPPHRYIPLGATDPPRAGQAFSHPPDPRIPQYSDTRADGSQKPGPFDAGAPSDSRARACARSKRIDRTAVSAPAVGLRRSAAAVGSGRVPVSGETRSGDASRHMKGRSSGSRAGRAGLDSSQVTKAKRTSHQRKPQPHAEANLQQRAGQGRQQQPTRQTEAVQARMLVPAAADRDHSSPERTPAAASSSEVERRAGGEMRGLWDDDSGDREPGRQSDEDDDVDSSTDLDRSASRVAAQLGGGRDAERSTGQPKAPTLGDLLFGDED
mmetsp:Transcript_38090/g.107595  ORF Transcript_38090/g.107595 Transcript_38090/m.107595 type:complete len:812 (+) Transcript_38090:183-2618(+)|eukprot:CAMPEP_0117674518 /NCGR_PEP_ID=MMETSP0804-20121206/15087_1 /TAXON_ID=1074897 /ORGANISM="Tetraselmis astigmatica, Strain CCMP880" /LENGTH=811 /DNA_ID=CAMNT_0005483405 /DNA_START=173 /DNA_END=2608 /DNA_ORIENTATION=-